MSFRGNNVYFSLFIIAIYVLPFIISPTTYQDDIGRSIWGYYDWESNGRPLTTLAMQLFNFFVNVFNLAPLYIIIGLIGYIYAFHSSCTSLFNNNKIFISVSCLIAISSPFFLENLAYNFDSMTMLFSVSLSFLSAFTKKEGVTKFLFQSILVLAILSLYQAALNLYIMLIIIATLIQHSDDIAPRKQIKSCITSMLSLFFAYTIYTFVIAKTFVKLDYNITHSQITYNINDIYTNIILFIDFIKTFLNTYTSKILFIFSFGIMILSSIKSSSYIIHRSESNIYSIFLVTILLGAPFISAFLIAGSLVMLKSPIISPRVLMGGVGYMFLFSYSAYNLTRDLKRGTYYFIFIIIPISSYCFNLCYTFNAALKDQARLEGILSDRISSSLFNGGFSPEKNELIIVGAEPRTILSINAIMRIPYMEKILPLYFYGNNPFGFIKLRQTYFLRDIKITDEKTLENGMKMLNTSSELSRNEYFITLKNENVYFIKFK